MKTEDQQDARSQEPKNPAQYEERRPTKCTVIGT